MLVPGLSTLCLWVMAAAYLKLEPMKGASLGLALPLLANFRLDWKGLPRTNTLVYNKREEITDIKSFIILDPRKII